MNKFRVFRVYLIMVLGFAIFASHIVYAQSEQKIDETRQIIASLLREAKQEFLLSNQLLGQLNQFKLQQENQINKLSHNLSELQSEFNLLQGYFAKINQDREMLEVQKKQLNLRLKELDKQSLELKNQVQVIQGVLETIEKQFYKSIDSSSVGKESFVFDTKQTVRNIYQTSAQNQELFKKGKFLSNQYNELSKELAQPIKQSQDLYRHTQTF
ncbi:MAG: hypothetical protein NC908_04260, partial [Candidatus Omnitrophica bacterium]|nr:hypothetical protein [Candidatus Omnitrophota bacterium]